MAKSVRDVMTTKPTTVERSTSVFEVAKILKNEDVGSVPIVEGDQLVGIITDRDIVLRVIADGKDAKATTVGEIASTDLVTIDPEQDLDEALRLMAEHQVRRLPAVEEDGRLVGMLAQADVALAGSDKRTGAMVEEISK